MALKPPSPPKTFWEKITRPMGGKPRVSTQEFVVFSRQLATMIESGIPLAEALEILYEQQTDPGFQGVLYDVHEKVSAGVDFSEALREHKVFDQIFVNMVRAGEASGQLDEILDRVAGYQESAAKLRSKIVGALTYPAVSLVLIAGITLFLMLQIIPKFKDIFDKKTKLTLNPITKTVLAVSESLRGYWWAWLMGVALVVVGTILFRRSPGGRRAIDRYSLKLPVFGPLFQKVAISRFSRTFATLIQSGVPIVTALDIVAATAGNKIIEEAVLDSISSIRSGESLEGPLAASKVFPPMVTRMIAVGEKSGALETLLEKIADFYDEQVNSSVEALSSLIEPLLIGVMGIVVGGIVLSIFLPLFQLMKRK